MPSILKNDSVKLYSEIYIQILIQYPHKVTADTNHEESIYKIFFQAH